MQHAAAAAQASHAITAMHHCCAPQLPMIDAPTSRIGAARIDGAARQPTLHAAAQTAAPRQLGRNEI